MSIPRRPQVLGTFATILAFAFVVTSASGAPISPYRGVESFFGVSGLPHPIGRANDVRMIEHEVRVELPSRRVSSRSILINQGAATSITLAIPERGETGEARAFPTRGFLRGLRCTVDGRRVTLARHIANDGLFFEGKSKGKPSSKSASFEDEYQVDWTVRLSLARGQKRTVCVWWVSGAASAMQNAPEYGSLRIFRYDLRDALDKALANTSRQDSGWAGNIARLSVTFDTRGLAGFDEIRFAPAARIRSRFAMWEARDVAPKKLPPFVQASWWPGVRRWKVNGREPDQRCLVVGRERVRGEFASIYPQRRAGRLWIPLQLLQKWASKAFYKRNASCAFVIPSPRGIL